MGLEYLGFLSSGCCIFLRAVPVNVLSLLPSSRYHSPADLNDGVQESDSVIPVTFHVLTLL